MARNLTIHKGEIWFAPFKAGTTTPDGYEFLGNCPEFNISYEDEVLDHYSSMSGVREKDDQVILEVTRTASVVTDDVSPENLAKFFLGSSSNATIVSSVSNTEAIAGVKAGRTYQIGVTANQPTGARKLANVAVADGGLTTYVLNTDYTVDLDLGLVTIVSGGAITDGDDIEVTYDEIGHSRQQVISGETAIEGQLKIFSYAPKGTKHDYFMPRVIIKPNGDLSLIQDGDFMTVPFEFEFLKRGLLQAIYQDGRPVTS